MRPLLLSASFAVLALAGCESSSGTGNGGEGGGDAAPTLPQNLADGWNEIKPGGETICSRGGEYAFWVKPGKTNKVIVDFIGGGACWNALTCSVADSIFEDSVDAVRGRVNDVQHGFYDHDNPENPFADWYHVIVPYCTGDIHWGNAVTTYNQGQPNAITINHKGAVNTRAVLDYVYANFSRPEQVLVTGCSAGSYGAALWSSHVMEHYQKSQVFQFGDSGAGIITSDFFNQSFPSWNAIEAFPSFIPELDPTKVDIMTKALPDLYAGIANHFPKNWMSQYNTIHDDNQLFYFQAMGGGDVNAWSAQMLASIDQIESRAPTFDSFIAPGEQHCILPYDNFYSVHSDGVKLTTWLKDRLDGKTVPSVRCQGAECDDVTP